MTSLWPLLVTLFLCCAIIDQFTGADDIQDLYFILNGYYNNFDQDKVEGGRHDLLEVWFKPVNVPQLQKEYVLYGEEAINGSVYRMYVHALTKEPNSPVIMGTFYNFTRTRNHKPGSFNTDVLANLTREDFDNSDGCRASYEEMSPGMFTENAMNCKQIIARKHPMYSVIYQCDVFRYEPSSGSKETRSLLSYFLIRKGPRYPNTGLPKGYKSPCKNSEKDPFMKLPASA